MDKVNVAERKGSIKPRRMEQNMGMLKGLKRQSELKILTPCGSSVELVSAVENLAGSQLLSFQPSCSE
jgi:hypothetical protein